MSRPAAALEHGLSAFGDYDEDDYVHGRFNDADNDDSRAVKDRDGDSDSSPHSVSDADDRPVLAFGNAPSPSTRTAIEQLVRRYYATARSENGALACRMVIAPLAASVVEDLGRPPGPRYLRGRSCAAVMTKVFHINRSQLTTYADELSIAAVRVEGRRGVAILRFRTVPSRQLELQIERGQWKVAALLDRELP
jgi:hypothetical protein